MVGGLQRVVGGQRHRAEREEPEEHGGADESRLDEVAVGGARLDAAVPILPARTEVRAGLLDGLQAAAKAGARAVVLMGSGRGFSAGAEMTEFRADRFAAALTWTGAEPFSLAYIVRAVTPGRLPSSISA